MTKFFIYIKHNFPFPWLIFNSVHDLIFNLFYKNRISTAADRFFGTIQDQKYSYRVLVAEEAGSLADFFQRQDKEQLRFFKPHAFSEAALRKQIVMKSFLAMAVWDRNTIIGYFFLRFFLNKTCFIGRIVDEEHQRKGIAKAMSIIMYGICDNLNFRCLTTVSKKNHRIIKLHQEEDSFHVLRELDNDYLLVEIRP